MYFESYSDFMFSMCSKFVTFAFVIVNCGMLLLSRFSHVQLLETPWTIAHQAPPSM